MTILLRALRRKTSLELSTPEDFMDAEMVKDGQAETNLSVFQVDNAQPHVVQVFAEYNVSFKDPKPPEPTVGIDLTAAGNFTVAQTAANTLFVFTRNCHRDLEFMDADDMLSMVRGIFPIASTRTHSATRDELKKFILDQLNKHHLEWVSACTRKPKWKNWAMQPSSPAVGGPGAGPHQPTTAVPTR
ncbi:MAG: hypothetical protein EOP84_10775, partial [Verrucomicrobiaceae bacterium]